MQSAIFSTEDREFMDAVKFDLNLFIEGNSFSSVKAVLVFPPFNNFRRFLVHKIVEDSYSSFGLTTFSVGQDFQRRIIICHSALKLRLKTLQETTKNHLTADRDIESQSKVEMIEKDVSKPKNVTANIYLPPGARSSASTSGSKRDDSHSKENRRNKVRRPDLQVYVPRPKRVSYGEVEKSRFTEDVGTSTSIKPRRSCLQEIRKSLSNPARKTNIDAVDLTEDESELPSHDNTPSEDCEMFSVEQTDVNKCSNCLQERRDTFSKPDTKTNVDAVDLRQDDCVLPTPDSTPSEDCEMLSVEQITVNKYDNSKSSYENKNSDNELETQSSPLRNTPSDLLDKNCVLEELSVFEKENKPGFFENTDKSSKMSSLVLVRDKVIDTVSILSNETNVTLEKPTSEVEFSSNIDCNKLEFSSSSIVGSKLGDDVLTISDDSQTMSTKDEVISVSSTVTESSYDSTDSSDSSLKRKSVKKCRKDKYLNDSSTDKNKFHQEIKCQSSSFERKDDDKDFNPEERNLKNRRILHGKPESDVLIIHNNLSKQDKAFSNDGNKEQSEQRGKSSETQSKYDPNDCDWDTLFTDDGECLVPGFVEELTKNVGRVKITTAKSDYRPYQTEDERIGDGECIIEIYNFPAEFKTNDLLNIFAAYRNRSFHIKWVDDTHALGVFGSPLVADEVLATNLPFVKTRPLRLAIAESRIKARGLALPPMERPKTCPALARRLVTGALGLRLPTASKEREAERLVLKEAREKRRLDLKQKEAVWEGNFN